MSKMAQKIILAFVRKSSTSNEGSHSQEVDTPKSELSSNPQGKKQKVQHVFQREKWPEK